MKVTILTGDFGVVHLLVVHENQEAQVVCVGQPLLVVGD